MEEKNLREYVYEIPELLRDGKTVCDLKGKVTLKIPSKTEQFNMMDECGFEFDEDTNAKNASMKKPKNVGKLIECSLKYYVKVEVEHKKTGEKFASVDDLNYGDGTLPVMLEIAGKLLNGFKAGEA